MALLLCAVRKPETIISHYKKRKMILVALVAELMEEYTVLLTRVLEHLFNDAPFPRRVRFLILRNLPFASSSRPPLLTAPRVN
ncbi:unnamed protein product [Dovyalis caffra]|uniref:Uncharacterized protein n=1 Tax=Dovyalis caffra TaxID=77055 RepID=A0AAV1SY81_9ROSI|nr:unnamed protein product [Dovyalis caffra]